MDNDKLPVQANCDPDSPEEFALWAFTGMPGMKGAPLPFPVAYLKMVSRRLWDAGFRHDPELQTIKYKRPAMDEHWLTNPGSWVPVDEDFDEPSLKEYIEGLPLSERQTIANHLGLGDT